MDHTKPPAVDLFEIDLESGKNWLAHGKEMNREKIRQRAYLKHRSRHILEQAKGVKSNGAKSSK
jgi:hypothetical protein